MATGGDLRATFIGIGPNDQTKNYTKVWEMAPVTGASVEAEVAQLLLSAELVVESYAAITKGVLASASLGIAVNATPIAGEAGAFANRAATLSGSVDGNPAKKLTFAIQAARDTIFVGDSGESTIVDINDASLSAYMDELNSSVLVSDGEVPSNVLTSGYRIDKVFSGKD